MDENQQSKVGKQTYSPLVQLTLARFREFYRQPEAIFWVYAFPLLIAVALGLAFREKPIERITIDVREDAGDPAAIESLKTRLATDSRLVVKGVTGEAWKKRLQSGRTDLVVTSAASGYDLYTEPNRPESILARHAVESVLFKESSKNGPTLTNKQLEERGQRYIDFLMPGLLGMNLMGGGLFGVGFVLADMRIRKLLKRFLATPMKRRDFLLSLMLSRMIFTVPEVLLLLGFGYLAFDVRNSGSFFSLLAIIVIGAAAFGGLGLLVASRAKTMETVSGLMNLVMLPMWILSGVFFKSDNFPEWMQPAIQALPLTALNDAIRGVMLEGQSLAELGFPLAILVGWGIVSFTVALKIFRWQ